MPALLTHLTVLALTALAAWWLSGYDTKVTGADKKADGIRRAGRCGITLILVEVFFRLPGVLQVLPIVLLIGGLFALVWCGCVVEMFARWFHHLIDPADHREFDSRQQLRDLDRVAGLIQNGRKEEAIQMCRALQESGEVSILTLEAMLERLGIKPDQVQFPRPLAEASRLRLQQRFGEAEAVLAALLAKNPTDVAAAMMLMRLYAEELHQPEKARLVLASLEKQPHTPADHVEFARRSIAEWSRGKPGPEAVAPQPESLEDLIARGYFGTAIEILERKIREQPGDYDSRIRLVEVHARHCGNVQPAMKIVRQLELDPGFTPEQIRNARARLEEWRQGRLRHP